MKLAARLLVSAVAVVTAISPFLADYNNTHMFNPAWPPHAKFHDAMTTQLGALLGVSALYLVWRRSRGEAADRASFTAGVVAAALYWLALGGANFFPNTAYVDPEFAADLPLVAGVLPPQVVLGAALLAMLAAATLLRRLDDRATRRELAPAGGERAG
jgi:hypothetical protein